MANSNLDTYADPKNFDLESGSLELEGSLLLDLALQESGPVLELGCGTGRATIPLAEKGVDVTGLDVLPHMLARAQDKAGDLPIRWICEDVRSFQLERHFALIFTRGAVFQHLLRRADQEAMLSRVREHLAPGGRFILDLGYKNPASMVDIPEEQEWQEYLDDQGRTMKLMGTDRYDHVKQIWYQRWRRQWIEAGKPQSSETIELALRYVMPQEMETLLHYNGFAVQAQYGDWDGRPFTTDGYLQIYVCTHRE